MLLIAGLITAMGVAAGIYCELQILTLTFSLIFLTAIFPMCVSKMTTEIREDGIYIYYFPCLGIWAKRYPADEIGRVEAKVISPIGDAGGGM
jgi:hypothetical protein